MADSAFWRDLAAQFLTVPDNGMLRADGHYIVGSDVSWNWELTGGAGDFASRTFETLARRGAAEIAPAGTPDLLIVWLEELRKSSSSFTASGLAHEALLNSKEGTYHAIGSISHLRQASATLCKRLEAHAVQSEFEEKHRSDPTPVPIPPAEETIAVQLQTLRDKCHMTEEELAEKIDVDIRSVQRHLAGQTIPRAKQLRAYERIFSNLLKINIVIRKMP